MTAPNGEQSPQNQPPTRPSPEHFRRATVAARARWAQFCLAVVERVETLYERRAQAALDAIGTFRQALADLADAAAVDVERLEEPALDICAHCLQQVAGRLVHSPMGPGRRCAFDAARADQ